MCCRPLVNQCQIGGKLFGEDDGFAFSGVQRVARDQHRAELALLLRGGHTNLAQRRRKYAAYPDAALRLLLSALS